jgi:hypothetical protein
MIQLAPQMRLLVATSAAGSTGLCVCAENRSAPIHSPAPCSCFAIVALNGATHPFWRVRSTRVARKSGQHDLVPKLRGSSGARYSSKAVYIETGVSFFI